MASKEESITGGEPGGKTPEEMEMEKAREQLEAILRPSRPKTLQQGVTSGVGNIITGAVGAAGIAVLAPTVGLAAGAQRGGLIGGGLGAAGGAVVGGVGAAALAIGGTLAGVTQIVRGVAAVPQQIIAPRQGKWWNDAENDWIITDLENDGKELEGVPEDDSDILGKLQDELDQEASKRDISGSVKEMYYYDVLDVDPKAEPSVIKRRYYLLARKYHPDKVGTDDTEAADKFKEIAEAYQVLSDPELRAKYDKDGREALSADKTTTDPANAKVDPTLLYAFLFGSDRFSDYVGRLSTATSASVGDSQKISMKDAREVQTRRCTRLAMKLVERIKPWIEGNSTDDFVACRIKWTEIALDLCNASFGIQMVHTIGKAYSLTATQFLGSLESGLGLPSVGEWARNRQAKMEQARANNQQKMDTLMANIDMVTLTKKYEQKMAVAKSDEEKEALQKELQKEASKALVQLLWTTTVVDITSTIHETAQRVFFDQSVDKDIRKKRAEAVKALGEAFEECPAPLKDAADQPEKDAQQLYEEAAFAAMVETIKRKDEAAHGAATVQTSASV